MTAHRDLNPPNLRARPDLLDAAPLGPLVEPWPHRAPWVCVWLTDRDRVVLGAEGRWSLVRECVGRIAVGWVGAA
jgi:hypothetical protein